jgi:sortase A
MKRILWYTIGGVIVAVILFVVFYFSHNGSLENFVTQNFVPTTGQVGAANISIGSPVRLIIPTIRVDAAIEKKGLAPDGTLSVPTGPFTVAWYQYGPRPGDAGSAVISGHYGPWRTGAHSVFDNLNQLKAGDIIEVKDDKGNQLSFKVRQTKVYSKNAPASEISAIFNQNHGAHLNLITCSGTWLAGQKTYTDRFVVFTDLVK